METVANSIYRRMRRIGSPFYQALRDAKRMTEFSRARRSLLSTGLTDPELRLLQQVSEARFADRPFRVNYARQHRAAAGSGARQHCAD